MVFSEKLASRYRELKKLAGDAVLPMQVGAFMQVMDDDARTVSVVTGLKLRMAGDVDAPVSWTGQGKNLDCGQGHGGMTGRHEPSGCGHPR